VWRTTLTLPPAPENVAPIGKIGVAIAGGVFDIKVDESGRCSDNPTEFNDDSFKENDQAVVWGVIRPFKDPPPSMIGRPALSV
jgi:hypothetical protein